MKVETFSYENPNNKPGKFINIPIESLFIPSEDEQGVDGHGVDLFQRNEISKAKTKRRAENWDWFLCGVLKVIQINGTYCVVDGGNRLRSARLNGKIKKMPCMVYDEMSITDTARAFLGDQILRTSVKACERHNTGIIAKDPIAEVADKIITSSGYTTKHRSGEFGFDAVHALYSIIRIDTDIAEYAFSVCSDICSGDRIFKDLLLGVFELERRSRIQRKGATAFTRGNIDKLSKVGVNRIMSAINSKRAMVNNPLLGRSIPAKAILEIINKGKGGGKLRVSMD